MVRHVFLTGKKQVGKSTLVRKVLNDFDGKAGGFFTVRTDAFLKNGYSVHLLGVNGEPSFDEETLLFLCGREGNGVNGKNRKISCVRDRFNLLGCRALVQCRDCSLVVMDELGPNEAEALLFRRAVLQQLEGSTPVLGVLQAPARFFWPEVTDHPAVELIEITESNREEEEILKRILSVIRHRIPSES